MLQRLQNYQQRWCALSKEEQSAYLKLIDTDQTVRKEVGDLAWYFLKRRAGSCGFCLVEFHIKLIALKPETAMKTEQKTKDAGGFALRAGTVLHDPVNKDFAKILTPHTLTNELAIYHLANNPSAAAYFTEMPVGWEKDVAELLGTEKPMTARRKAAAAKAAEKEAVDKERESYLASVAEDIKTFVAAGMTLEQIIEDWKEPIEAGNVTAEILTDMFNNAWGVL